MEVVCGILAMISVCALCVVGMREYVKTAKLENERQRKQIQLYETLIEKLELLSALEISEEE